MVIKLITLRGRNAILHCTSSSLEVVHMSKIYYHTTLQYTVLMI